MSISISEFGVPGESTSSSASTSRSDGFSGVFGAETPQLVLVDGPGAVDVALLLEALADEFRARNSAIRELKWPLCSDPGAKHS